MNVLEIDAEVLMDGVAVPGFPLRERYIISDLFSEIITQASSTPSYNGLAIVPGPVFDDDGDIRVLILAPDQAISVRFVGQTGGAHAIPAGGVAAFIGARIHNTPAILTTTSTHILVTIGRLN